MNVPLSQPDVVEPAAPQLPEHSPGTLQRTKKWWIVGGIILVAATIVLAALYSDHLGSKVAPGRKFKVLGPSTIQAGQSATIVWDTSTEIAKQYPYEKIEYCYGKTLKRKCVILAAAAPNNGKAVVKVPASVPAGKGYLKFTARDPQKKLFGSMVSNSNTVSAQPASTALSSGGSSGGGGGSSGGGGGGSGGSGGGEESNRDVSNPTTQPAGVGAEFLVPIDNEVVAPGDALDVRIKLTETSAAQLTCQEWILDGVTLTSANWESGQSPDLSAGPCQ